MSEPMPKTTRSIGKSIEFGCVGTLATAGILFLVGMWMFARLSDTVDTIGPVIKDFLTSIEAGKYEVAYPLIDKDWQEAETFEQFRGTWVLVAGALGKRQSLTASGYEMDRSTHGGTTATAYYTAAYENDDTVDITVTLHKFDGEWRVIKCQYASEVPARTRPCGSCGAANIAAAKFCSQCGQELDAVQRTSGGNHDDLITNLEPTR